jgi:hypothetical protein
MRFESERVDLKTFDARRNKVTHDYLTVELNMVDKELESSTVDLDDLQKQTRDVLRLAKYAVLYALSAIRVEEERKGTADRVLEQRYWSHPGNQFM